MRNAYNHLQLAPMYSFTVKLSKHWLITSGIVSCDQMAGTLKGCPIISHSHVCNRLGKSNLRVLDNKFGSLKFHSVFCGPTQRNKPRGSSKRPQPKFQEVPLIKSSEKNHKRIHSYQKIQQRFIFKHSKLLDPYSVCPISN